MGGEGRCVATRRRCVRGRTVLARYQACHHPTQPNTRHDATVLSKVRCHQPASRPTPPHCFLYDSTTVITASALAFVKTPPHVTLSIPMNHRCHDVMAGPLTNERCHNKFPLLVRCHISVPGTAPPIRHRMTPPICHRTRPWKFPPNVTL